jgi:hypothetical protein
MDGVRTSQVDQRARGEGERKGSLEQIAQLEGEWTEEGDRVAQNTLSEEEGTGGEGSTQVGCRSLRIEWRRG